MSLEETQREFNTIDYGVWRACAGKFVHLPKLNSKVYYFSQGHALQASSKVNFSPLLASKSGVLCRLSTLTFLADPLYDEVLVKFGLEPLIGDVVVNSSESNIINDDEDEDEDTGFVSYNKILTISDANNGGGFSVPRNCAEMIFPKLNFADDPPMMNINIFDLQGRAWEFRHIYRGTPRRHLFTCGWSKFVNAKNIISKDTVVFIKNKENMQMYVGLRRIFRGLPWGEFNPDAEGHENEPIPGRFSRTKRGRVPPQEVIDAAERASNGIPFEAVYYPRPGMTEFVVAADKVDDICLKYLCIGLKVKMSQETDDGLKETFRNGFVDAIIADNNRSSYPGGCWGMLEVLWNEEIVGLPRLERVNPWKLHFVGATPINTQRDIPLPSIGFSHMMDQSNPPPSYVNSNTVVDDISIQGTRHFLTHSFLINPERIEDVTNLTIDSASPYTSLADTSIPHLPVERVSSETPLADSSEPHLATSSASPETPLDNNSCASHLATENASPETPLANSCAPHLAVGSASLDTSLVDNSTPHLAVDSASPDTSLVDSSASHLAVDSASPDTSLIDSSAPHLAIDSAFPDTSVANSSTPHMSIDSASPDTFVANSSAPHMGIDNASPNTSLVDSDAPHLTGCNASRNTTHVTDSQNSVLAVQGVVVGQQTSNLPFNERKTPVSFRLFGNTIRPEQPLKG